MPEISRRRALLYALALLVALLLVGRLVVGREGGQGPVAGPAPAGAGLTAETVEPPEVVVHVVGAVRRPGILRLPEGSRVDDAIEAAGGAGPRAALELVNLAAPVADGQQVVVPVAARAGTGGDAAEASAAGGGRVRLNTATLEELDELPGVGPVTAQKILDYREENGAFSSVDELDAVPGIGPARLAELRELLDL